MRLKSSWKEAEQLTIYRAKELNSGESRTNPVSGRVELQRPNLSATLLLCLEWNLCYTASLCRKTNDHA